MGPFFWCDVLVLSKRAESAVYAVVEGSHDVPEGLVVHVLQGVRVEEVLYAGGEFVVGVPELEEYAKVLKNGE